jgi:apolipoprotein N-acyltransferase
MIVATMARSHGAIQLVRGSFRMLLAGQVVGELSDGLAQISFAQVVLFSPGRGVTPLRLVELLAITLVPFSLVGPFAGVLIDRWDRRHTLVLVSVLRAGFVLLSTLVLVTRSEVPTYVAAVLLLSASRFVLDAKGAALPLTVPGGRLVTANSISALGGSAATFVGAVGGSAFVGRWPAAGFIAAAVGYLAAALCFERLPRVGGGVAGPLLSGLRRVLSELATGLRAIAANKGIKRPMLAVGAHRVLLGAGFILLVLIADSSFHLKTPGYGLALLVTGVGTVLGTLSAPAAARRFRPEGVLVAAFLVSATAALVAGFSLSLAALVAGIGFVAYAFQAQKVLADSLIQRSAPDAVRGRVFSVYDVLYNSGFVVAGLLLAPAWQAGRAHMLLWWLAAAFVAAAMVLARVQRSWPFVRTAAVPVARRWWTRAGALLCGALPALAFPKADAWWLGFVGLVPMMMLIRAAPSGREGTMRAWWAGAGFSLAAVYWLIPNIGPFELVIAFGLGGLVVLWGRIAWGLLHGRVGPLQLALSIVVLPSAWVAAEYVRSWSSLGGPWDVFGASQWNDIGFLSLASLGGVWLVSFGLVAVNSALACALVPTARTRVRAASVAAAVAVAAAGFGYGAARPDQSAPSSVTVAVVQPGLSKGPAQTVAAEEAYTYPLARSRPSVVIWGESSVGFDLQSDQGMLRRIESVSRAVHAEVLVNEDARHGAGSGIYKTALLVGPQGPVAYYNKMRLVPFGEYIPLRFALGWLDKITRAAAVNRQRGSSLVLMRPTGSPAVIGPLVCFESTFPDMSRNLVSMGANLLVVQTSDSTFQQSWAPDQHASLAAVRAVESGRSTVQAALTGVTAVFDPEGRRLAWHGVSERGGYLVRVPLATGQTPFVRYGDWLPVTALSILFLAGLGEVLRRSRRARLAGAGRRELRLEELDGRLPETVPQLSGGSSPPDG